MTGNQLESPVARGKVAEELKLKRRSYTASDVMEARIDALAASVPFDRADIIRACLSKALTLFEADEQELYRVMKENLL